MKRFSKPEADFQYAFFKKKKVSSRGNENRKVNASWTEYDMIAYI